MTSGLAGTGAFLVEGNDLSQVRTLTLLHYYERSRLERVNNSEIARTQSRDYAGKALSVCRCTHKQMHHIHRSSILGIAAAALLATGRCVDFADTLDSTTTNAPTNAWFVLAFALSDAVFDVIHCSSRL